MNYAMIENGVVTNLIWLYERNASDFPQAVKIGDLPVWIGDAYADGVFSREGEVLKTPLEEAVQYSDELNGAYVDLAYENALLTLGV